MTIVPKKKRSQSKKRIRHSTRQTLSIKRLVRTTNVVKCSNCGSAKLSHRVCQTCGFYKGKQVISIKVKKSETVVDADE